MHVVDPSTLAFPNYDGNGMFLSMGNVLQNKRVGLLFIDFERQRRLLIAHPVLPVEMKPFSGSAEDARGLPTSRRR